MSEPKPSERTFEEQSWNSVHLPEVVRRPTASKDDLDAGNTHRQDNGTSHGASNSAGPAEMKRLVAAAGAGDEDGWSTSQYSTSSESDASDVEHSVSKGNTAIQKDDRASVSSSRSSFAAATVDIEPDINMTTLSFVDEVRSVVGG